MENLDRIGEHFGLFFGISGKFWEIWSLKYLQFREEFSHLHSHPGKIAISMEEYLPLGSACCNPSVWGEVELEDGSRTDV